MTDIETGKLIRSAIKKGDLVAVAALIGDDPSRLCMMTPFGTWLHVASSHGQLPIVQWLLEKGIDINRQGSTAGASAIHSAASKGHLEIVRYILDHGAVMDIEEPVRNPLFAAIYAGSKSVVELLVERGAEYKIRYYGDSMKGMDACDFAIERGQLEIAEYLRAL